MKYRYAEMIWHETKEAAEEGRVAVIPVATYEDHGPHLPVDVDVVLCTEICERAVARIPSEAVVIPPVLHGYSPHHMDFHGTITITWDTFIRYVKDVCCSLAHHGFTHILIVNGHGSNASPLDLAARLSIIDYEGQILCASVSHWDLRKVKEAAKTLRDSDHGGAAHAGEYETSLYLALRPDLVDMSKAVDERTPLSPSFQIDLLAGTHPKGSAARLTPYWSVQTGSSVLGDATKATKEKGEQFLEAAVEGLIELIRELRETPILPRRNQH
ncbi:MAG: creatininase family protein [Chloroflexota bacterium]